MSWDSLEEAVAAVNPQNFPPSVSKPGYMVNFIPTTVAQVIISPRTHGHSQLFTNQDFTLANFVIKV